MVLAVVSGLVTAHGFALGGGEGEDGEHGSGGGVLLEGGFGLAALFVDDDGGFQGPEAAETPEGVDHSFDEGHFVGGFGEEFGDEGTEEFEKTLAGFAGEEDGGGEEAVVGGIAGVPGVQGGIVLAARGFWAGGFLCVGAVGGQLLF